MIQQESSLRRIPEPGIIDSYGTAETGAAMVRLFDNKEYTVHNDSFVVNIYDEKNRPGKRG